MNRDFQHVKQDGFNRRQTYLPEGKPVLCALLLILFGTCTAIADERSEAARLAEKYNAEAEVVLWDGTRVDLLSDTHAYEVEWATNQYQSFGQAAWYGIVTGKQPAVILLVKDRRLEARHIYRATAVAERLKIPLHLEFAEPTP